MLPLANVSSALKSQCCNWLGCVYLNCWFIYCLNLFFSRCDSPEKLKALLSRLEQELKDSGKFKDFYQFTFNFAKNPGQKGLGKMSYNINNNILLNGVTEFQTVVKCSALCLCADLEMAVAYWNLVLSGRFKFLDLWNRFLLVSQGSEIRISISTNTDLIKQIRHLPICQFSLFVTFTTCNLYGQSNPLLCYLTQKFRV